MAEEDIDRGTKGILSKEKRYSIFSLAKILLTIIKIGKELGARAQKKVMT